jgi:hypothetical protein
MNIEYISYVLRTFGVEQNDIALAFNHRLNAH